MNQIKLERIFKNYVEKFEWLNSGGRDEYYKWQVCHEFPILMKKALEVSDEEFSQALYQVKKATYNIIDSTTMPLYGLVDFAKEEPDRVRQILKNLYADDGGDLKIQMQKISDFMKCCDELSGDSYRYKQNSHSVSALLFLNDPDHHYMYKATQSKAFADHIEFYDDWGTGDNIKLDVYYRMCDELVSDIKKDSVLWDADKARFDGRLGISGGELHPDTEKHILAFDIIYCSTVYDLYAGVPYTKLSPKEKKEFIANKEKAAALKAEYEKTKADMDTLIEVKEQLPALIAVGDEVRHVRNGIGMVKSLNGNHLTISFGDKDLKLDFMTVIANDIISVDNEKLNKLVADNRRIIKEFQQIPKRVDHYAHELKPFEEYLD